jgi:hypothetical protein
VREHVQLRRFGTTIDDANAKQHVVRLALGVLDEHVEVAVVIENPRVAQLELRLRPASPAIALDELRIRERALRILVEELQVRVRRRRVEVVVLLLHVLAVVALGVRQSEQALLQYRVTPVPERERQADTLVVIAQTREAVFPPAVGAAARVVVREVVPGFARRAVILAHGAPLPFAQVGAEATPGRVVLAIFEQAPGFGGECTHRLRGPRRHRSSRY